jgi:hypothetical protein
MTCPPNAFRTRDALIRLEPRSPCPNSRRMSLTRHAVMYLEKAAFVTGEILHVDGGASAGRW